MHERIARLLAWTRARLTKTAPPPRPTPPRPPQPAVISLPHTSGMWSQQQPAAEVGAVRTLTDAERLSAKVRAVNTRGRWGK
ncbi:hypothetical protein [Streptomyces sp. NPDC046261]|uniref:hypothetical protein n=1 Tax=Streptomyces sp. NPDC046261 TaxID=3157200 RepID=UPI0033E194DF